MIPYAIPAASLRKTSSLGSSGKIILAQALSAGHQEEESQWSGSLQAQLQRYDDLGRKLFVLGNAAETRRISEEELKSVENASNENAKALKKNRDDQPRAERRLHRNAHPRFLHYFQINREEKVRRLTHELEELKQDEKIRVELSRRYRTEIEIKRALLKDAIANETEMINSITEQKRIFDNVVNSQPPTINLINLQSQIG